MSSGGNAFRGEWRGGPGFIVGVMGLVVLSVGLLTHGQRAAELEGQKAYRNGEAYQQLQAAADWSMGFIIAGIAVTGAGALFSLMYWKRKPDRADY